MDNNLLKKVHVKTSFFDDPFNNHAIVGTFYFKKAEYFLEGLSKIYEKNIILLDNLFQEIQCF